MTLTELSPHHVLKSTPQANITCHWCKKIMAACDGVAPLTEVARRTHIPLQTCLKLVGRGLSQGWFEVVHGAPAADNALTLTFWDDLNLRLQSTLGQSGELLLSQATRMTRLDTAALSYKDYIQVLLALELAADASQRPLLRPHLEALRSQYAA